LVERHPRDGSMLTQTVTWLFVLVFLTPSSHLIIETATSRQSATVPAKSGDSAPKAFQALEMLTPTEGVNFNSYMHDLYISVKHEWFASMPPSVQQGQRGIDIVQFRILQDGTVPEDFLKLRQGSGRKDFDEASLGAIRKTAPFKPSAEGLFSAIHRTARLFLLQH
jgi:outer membrane biosynthesis protein TonB